MVQRASGNYKEKSNLFSSTSSSIISWDLANALNFLVSLFLEANNHIYWLELL